MIPYGRQEVTDDDIASVIDVLRGEWLTQGPTVDAFERELAGCVNVNHAVAVNSATSALHIACLALGVGPGDTVWTTPNTFVASANCARLCGAKVDFVDIDPLTYNMSIEKLAAKLEREPAPKVLIPVHFSGRPVEQDAIAELAERYGFRVIEDASHAIGASRDGEPVGSCRWSDITVFSFHPVKIVTTAEGGAATTNDGALARAMRDLRSHGVTKDADRFVQAEEGGWYYEQHVLGLNYRLTDVQAALGRSQLQRLNAFVGRREVLADRYDTLLAQLPLERPRRDPRARSSWHLYVVRIDPTRATVDRRTLYDRLRAAGIGVQVHYYPVHLQPYYRALGFKRGDFPRAEAYYEQAFTLPLYPAMTEADQDRVVAELSRALWTCPGTIDAATLL